jgi:proline iminopeptidase
MPFIEHALGRTHYTVRGHRSKRPAIVWLHGGPGGMHNPKSRLFDLAEGRQVYSYTQMGSGKSGDLPAHRRTIATFVKELRALTRAWDLEQFHLMGGSWGATLALEYYLKYPTRQIKSLVLQSPMLSAHDWQRDANRLIKQLSKDDQKVIRYCHEINATDSAIYQAVMRRYYRKHVLRNDEKLDAMLHRKNPRGGAIYQHMWGPSEFVATGTLKDHDRTGDFAAVNAPTLIVCGEHDEATPGTGRRYAKAFPQGHFEMIRGASHAIWEEKPERLSKKITEFLNAVERTASSD